MSVSGVEMNTLAANSVARSGTVAGRGCTSDRNMFQCPNKMRLSSIPGLGPPQVTCDL